MRSLAATVAAVAGLMFQGAGTLADGERAYREGRPADAAAAFAAAVVDRGAAAPPELLYDLAVAAWAAGDREQSAAALERAAAVAAANDREFARRLAFVRGLHAFARAEAAAKLAAQVEAEPFAFRPALEQMAVAVAQWRLAVMAADDWPAARRNAERAQARLAELQAQRDRAEADKRRRTGAAEQPKLVPTGDQPNDAQRDGGAGTDAQEQAAQPLRTELSPQQVAELFARLQQKQQQKAQLRRTARNAARAAVERDW